MPPTPALVGLLDLPQFMLEPRRQILGGQQPAPFIENLGLDLNDPLLRRLAFPTDVIHLLLQGATVDNLTVQRGLKRFCPALQFCTLGLGIRELLAQGIVGIPSCPQLACQGLDDGLQRGDGGGYGFGRLVTRAGLDSLAWFSWLAWTSRQHFRRHADFRFKSVISDAPGPLSAPRP